MSGHIDEIARIAEELARKNKQREEEDAKGAELLNAWKAVREWCGTDMRKFAQTIAALFIVLDRQALLSILDTPPVVDEEELATYRYAVEIGRAAMKSPDEAARKIGEVANMPDVPRLPCGVFSPKHMVNNWLRRKLMEHIIKVRTPPESINPIGTIGTGTGPVSDQNPEDSNSTRALLTPDEFAARYDRRAMVWYARDDLPVMPVPDLPLAIQQLAEPSLKQRATEVWQATCRLMQAINAWQDWFREMHEKKDANPVVALWCSETAHESIRTLCIHRVNATPFDREPEQTIFDMLPPLPDDWSMGGKHYKFDSKQGLPVEYEGTRWQDEQGFIAKYYLGRDARLMTSNRLFGLTRMVQTMREKYPSTVFSPRTDALPTGSAELKTMVESILSKVQALRDAIANAPDPSTFVYPDYLQHGGSVLNPEDSPSGVMEEKGQVLRQLLIAAGDMLDVPRKVRDALKKVLAELDRPMWAPSPGTGNQREWLEMLDDALSALREPSITETDLPKILSHAKSLKRAIEADELSSLNDCPEFERWRELGGQQGAPLTIQMARTHACNELCQLLIPINAAPFVESIDLTRTKAEAVLALWEATRGNSVYLHLASKKKAVIQAIDELHAAANPKPTHSADFTPVSLAQKKIPPAKRTKPMSLREAARLMGCGTSRDAAEKLRAAIDAGAVLCEKLTRQQHVFSLADFPKEQWRQAKP